MAPFDRPHTTSCQSALYHFRDIWPWRTSWPWNLG